MLDLLYPPGCPFCGRINVGGAPCEQCCKTVDLMQDDVQGPGECDKVVAAFLYKGLGRSAVLRYKQLGLRGVGSFLATYVAVAVRRHLDLDALDLCTSVPSNPKSVRQRGFSASEELALSVADMLSMPYLETLTHTGVTPQKQLGREERFKNVQNSYTIVKGLCSTVEQKRILLVDDVMTTGATLSACAALLVDAGAASVSAAVVAVDIV